MEPASTPLTPGYFRLATILRGMLRLSALLALAEICYHAWAVHVLNDWLDDPSTYKLVTAQLIDDLRSADVIATVLLMLATGILFIVWLYRGSRSDRVSRAWMRRGAGWAIGGWFVPFGNLVLPAQQVHDLYRGAFVGRNEGKPLPGSALLGWWWAMWLCSGVMSWVALIGRGDPTGDGLQALRNIRTTDVIDLVGSVFTLAAALLAAAVVGRITGLLRRP